MGNVSLSKYETGDYHDLEKFGGLLILRWCIDS